MYCPAKYFDKPGFHIQANQEFDWWLVQSVRHWQESRSRKISRRNDSIFSRSLEKIGFSFLFLFSIFKIFRKNFYFSSRFMRFFNPFSFSFQFSRCLRKNSLSLLDWWDSETQISFSSRFSRFWEKFLLLFSISEIFKNKIFRNKYLTSLNFWDFFPVSISLKDVRIAKTWILPVFQTRKCL